MDQTSLSFSTVALRVFAWILTFAAFVLIISGGPAVDVSDTSMRILDFLNQTARLPVAVVLTVSALFLALGLWSLRAEKLFLRLALAVVGFGCLEIFLNASSFFVAHRLPAVILRDFAKQSFFSLTAGIAVLNASSPELEPHVSPDAKRIRRLSFLTIFFILWQLVAGAILQYTGRGLHAHLLGALLVGIHAVLLSRKVLIDPEQRPELRGLAMMLVGLVGVQIVLGYFSWREPVASVITMHLANAALIYSTTVLLALQSYRLMVPSLKLPEVV